MAPVIGYLVVGIVVLLLIIIIKRQKKNKTRESDAYVVRRAHITKADEAFEAAGSGDLNRMLKAVSTETNPIDRHFLLQTIVNETYKKRKDTEMRRICKNIGEKHLLEFHSIALPLKREFDNTLPRVTTFQHLATIYAEDGNYDRAIEICKVAIDYDLHDNTQSGFEGRIKRIEKQKNKTTENIK